MPLFAAWPNGGGQIATTPYDALQMVDDEFRGEVRPSQIQATDSSGDLRHAAVGF